MKNRSKEIKFCYMHPRNRDSVVSIVTRLRVARFGVRAAAGERDFSLFETSIPAVCLSSLQFNGYRELCSRG
jgi:hypothetical protein